MALRGPFPVDFGQAFPHGAYVTSEVEPMYGFTDGQKGQQETDEHNRLMWAVTVLDADPEAKGPAKSVKVKLAATHQPVPPAPKGDSPFAAVEFDGLMVTPYVSEVMKGRPKVVYSYRATGLHAPKPAASTPSGSSSQNGSNTGASSSSKANA